MVQPPSYNFVKAGMLNFTRYLACYYGRRGVRVNCISPGGYRDQQHDEFVRRYEERVPLGWMTWHADLQGAVVFLASDASSYVIGVVGAWVTGQGASRHTGTTLTLDGGWQAGIAFGPRGHSKIGRSKL
jgi:NAD(P)-dependent dehydrogenase (short-subunit alcohol dehydrogenase family)